MQRRGISSPREAPQAEDGDEACTPQTEEVRGVCLLAGWSGGRGTSTCAARNGSDASSCRIRCVRSIRTTHGSSARTCAHTVGRGEGLNVGESGQFCAAWLDGHGLSAASEALGPSTVTDAAKVSTWAASR